MVSFTRNLSFQDEKDKVQSTLVGWVAEGALQFPRLPSPLYVIERISSSYILSITDGQPCVGTQVKWNAIQRRLSYDVLTSVKALPAPGIGPSGFSG